MANDYNGFNPTEQARAKRWIEKMIQAGKLDRPTSCHGCGAPGGQDCVLFIHTEDYSEPFGPHTAKHHLCYVCHMILHSRFRCPKQWLNYLDGLRKGKIFPRFPQADWDRFKTLFLDTSAPFTVGPARPVLVFDTMGPGNTPLALKPIDWPRPPAEPEKPAAVQESLSL